MTGDGPAGPGGPGVGAGHGELDRAAGQLRQVLRLARAVVRLDNEQVLVDLIAAAAHDTLNYTACTVALRGDDGVFRYRATAGVSRQQDRLLRQRALTGQAYAALAAAAVRIGGVCWVPPGHPVRARADVQQGLLATSVSAPSRSWQPGSLLFAPLIGADGDAMGFLNPDDPLSGELPSAGQALLLETLAELTVMGLDVVQARTIERTTTAVALAQRRQLENLLQASIHVRGGLDLDQVLGQIATSMTTAGGFGRAAVYLRDPVGDLLTVRATIGLSAAEDERLRRNPVPLAEYAPLMAPQMRISRSYLFDHRYYELPDDLADKLSTVPDEQPPGWTDGQWHPLDTLTVPLTDDAGVLLGVISVDEPTNGLLPDRADVQALEFFADQCTVAIAQAAQFAAVQTLATTDALTGAANRHLLDERLARAVAHAHASHTDCAVLFVDVDHFKHINDTLGHTAGDQVLTALADTLRSRLRQSDLLARYGGEEFVVLLPGSGLAAAQRLAEDLRVRVMSLPVPVLAGGTPLRVSIGVAALSPRSHTPEALLAAADAALYTAKRAGRNTVRSTSSD